MTSDEFEQQVARIVEVLEGEGAVVQWNSRLSDPDNPTQSRQIDVTVRRGSSLSILECRHHSRPQDVQWVEELFGRRASLSADAIFGVSSSGFTAGAWLKAERLGVFLRDLQELSDEEIRSWGRKTQVRLSYVHFRRIAIFVVPTAVVRIARPNPRTLLRKSDGTLWPLDDLFRNAATRLNEENAPEGIVRIQYFARDLHIGIIPVPELIFQTEWRWVHRDLHLPFVLGYRSPGQSRESSEVLVEKNRYSDTEIFHTKAGVVPVVDVSLVPPEPRSYLRSVLIDMGQPLLLRGAGLVGLGEPITSLFTFKLYVYRRDSPEYAALFNDDSLFTGV